MASNGRLSLQGSIDYLLKLVGYGCLLMLAIGLMTLQPERSPLRLEDGKLVRIEGPFQTYRKPSERGKPSPQLLAVLGTDGKPVAEFPCSSLHGGCQRLRGHGSAPISVAVLQVGRDRHGPLEVRSAAGEILLTTQEQLDHLNHNTAGRRDRSLRAAWIGGVGVAVCAVLLYRRSRPRPQQRTAAARIDIPRGEPEP